MRCWWNTYKYSCGLGFRHVMRGLGYWRTLEYPWAIERVIGFRESHTRRKLTLLDIGSGDSPLPVFLAEQFGIETVCIDKDASELKFSSLHQEILHRRGVLNFRAQRGDVSKLKFLDNSFDIVTCISTFEHIQEGGDVAGFLECLRVLKPNGLMIFSVPYAKKAYFRSRTNDQFYDSLLINERFLRHLDRFGYTLTSFLLAYEKTIPFDRLRSYSPKFIKFFFLPFLNFLWSNLFLKASQEEPENPILFLGEIRGF